MIKLTPEQIKKIKTYGLAVAIGLVVLLGSFSIYLAVKNRSTLRELRLERDKYGLLEAEKKRLDSLEVVRLQMVEERDATIQELKTRYSWRQAEVKKLKDSLSNVLAEVDNLPAETSFEYINFTYPPLAERIFPLDSFQVKTFHRVDLGYKGEKLINLSLNSSITELKSLSDSYYMQSENYKSLYLDRKTYGEIVNKDNEALYGQVKTLNKQVNKQKLFKNLTGVGLLGTAGYIVVKSILK